MDQTHNLSGDDTGAQPTYPFYASDDPAYNMGYGQYPVASAPPRNPMLQDMHAPYAMGLMQPHQSYQGVFASSPHVSLPLTSSPPEIYEPVSPSLSGSDTSGDGLHHYSSSAANSPPSSRSHSLVHRTPRYNPTPSPTSSSGRRRGRSQDSDDDEPMGVAYNVENLANSRKEATRRQRIEAEQRRRDELRDGYAKLKDALPVSNQKSSKVSLLERATNHILALEKENKDLQARIAFLEQESARLRSLNEKISLSAEGTASPEAANRPLSPLPTPGARPQQPSLSGPSTPSGSENGH